MEEKLLLTLRIKQVIAVRKIDSAVSFVFMVSLKSVLPQIDKARISLGHSYAFYV